MNWLTLVNADPALANVISVNHNSQDEKKFLSGPSEMRGYGVPRGRSAAGKHQPVASL